MGNCWARVFRKQDSRRHIVLILIGLDNAGKTKTVNNLAGDRDDQVLPTVGFKAVNLVHRDTPVTVYDLGGGPAFRQIWPQYYSEVHGVIFVIDSSDFSRLDECRTVLEEVLSHDKISGKPILVLANKQDKQGALDDIDVVEKLDIEPLVNKYRCPTLVESYTAAVPDHSRKHKLDPGLKKGYHWLLNYIERRYGDINLRVQTDVHAELERRRRLMNKNASRASQTFTAVSDDIATQTGFENPNYESLTRDSTSEKDAEKSEEGIIVVKAANTKTNSLDTTVTIESAEDFSNNTSPKPKLSPLFGGVSNNSSSITETVHIELEPKSNFRKLSPIVRSRSNVNHIDFKMRPQSSPTFKKNNLTEEINNGLDDIEVIEAYLGDGREMDGHGNGSKKNAVLIDQAMLSQMQKELVLTERLEQTSKVATSEVTLQTCMDLDHRARPASASQLVRRQLEIFPGAHKRRLSLRYGHRNKTSPETLSVFHFEPTTKTLSRLDKGDYQHNYLKQRDVTM